MRARDIGPQHLRPDMLRISRADAMRVDQVVMRLGHRHARALLEIGEMTLDAAMHEGRMQRKTLARLLARLDVVET